MHPLWQHEVKKKWFGVYYYVATAWSLKGFMHRIIFVLWKITLAVAWEINRKGQTGRKIDTITMIVEIQFTGRLERYFRNEICRSNDLIK